VRVSQINGCAHCLHMHRQDAHAGRNRGPAAAPQRVARVRALHGAGTGGARLGRVAHADRRDPRAR
jgi:alkylhydroperoxidase family enzyme